MRIFTFLFLVLISLLLISKLLYSGQQVSKADSYSIFPLSDANADYIITEWDGLYTLTYYKYGVNESDQNTADTLSLFISSSPVNLEQYLNKSVEIQGDFVDGVPMCKEKCPRYIGTKQRPVVRITTISQKVTTN
jgi:hypothetical protein